MKTRIVLHASLFLALLASKSAFGQATLSSGAGVSPTWSDGTTWTSGTAPTGTDDVVFDYSNQPTSTTTTVNLSGPQAANSLTFGSANGPALGAFNLNMAGNTLTLSSGDITVASEVTGTQTIGLFNSGYQGSLGASNGAFTIDNNSSQELLLKSVLTDATVGTTVTYGGSGSGVIVVASGNSYTGATVIGSGVTIQALGGMGSFGALSSSAGVTVENGATLDLAGSYFDYSRGKAFTMSGSGVNGVGALTNSTGAGSFFNAITLVGDTTMSASTGAALDFTSAASIDNGGHTITFSGGGTIDVGSTITGSGGVTMNGTGTLIMEAYNSDYTGTTTLNSGTLNIGSGQTPLGSSTIVFNGGILQFSSATASDYSADFSTEANQQFRIDTNGNAVSGFYNSMISTNGSFQKLGAGLLELFADNTYNGLTTVSGGTLQEDTDNALGSGDLTVSGGSFDIANHTDTVGVVTLGGDGGSGDFTGTTGNLTASSVQVTGLGNTMSGGTLTGTATLAAGSSLSVANGAILNGDVVLSSGSLLGGSGRVGAITGNGIVAPGNSPGILTANSVQLGSSGASFNFELGQTGAPNWNAATASGNDVLHLTGAVPFTTGVAMAANAFHIYLDVSTLTAGDSFQGGIFADQGGDFLSSVSGGTYDYFVLGDGNGTILYNGTEYYTLAQYDALMDTNLSVNMSTSQVASANFADGTVTDGFVQNFSVVESVPEPSSVALMGGGLVLLALMLRFRRSEIPGQKTPSRRKV